MIDSLRTIAWLELVAVARRRWIQIFTLAFSLITIVVSWSAGAVNELGAGEGFGRTTVALLPLVLALVPLVALLVGITGQAGEPGSEGFLFAQPVTRAEVILGRWIGQAAALSAAIAAGLGAGAVFVAAGAGAVDVARFAVLAGASIALALVFLSIAALVSSLTDAKTAALGAGAFVWFAFVLLYDGAAISAAGWLTGRTGGYVLFGSVFGNPVDIVRIVILTLAGTPHLLGAAGESWTRFLGGLPQAMALATLALMLWCAIPLAASARVLARRDL
jgi:Cu-processing system permease protein